MNRCYRRGLPDILFSPELFRFPEQYGGTPTVRSRYWYDAGEQIGEGTYGQVFMVSSSCPDVIHTVESC